MRLKIWKKIGGEDCRVALDVSVAGPGCSDPWHKSDPVLQIDEAIIEVDGYGRDIQKPLNVETFNEQDWSAIYAAAREYVRKDF